MFLGFYPNVQISENDGKAMNLFFYMPTPSEKGNYFLNAVTPFAPPGGPEIFWDFRSFADRIRRPKNSFSVALFFNPTKRDLGEIVSVRDYLRDTKILLVLADQDEEMIAQAHRVFPTYITYIDNDASSIVSVLKQIVKTLKSGGDPEGSLR